jgi:UDP-N-acetylmuramyl pentapeptide phosphotransferase/UDP-N-acetylglucosamine-1-phosphate transferase
MMAFFSIALLAFVTAWVASYTLLRLTGPLQILDHPNERSLHSSPLPRTGGLAIWAGSLAAIVVALITLGNRIELAWIGGAVLLVGIVSLVDDRSHVPVAARLLAHVAAAGLLLAGGLGLRSTGLLGLEFALPAPVTWALTLLFVVWMINLYNFMDGMDGFAGGMAVFGFGTLGILAYLTGDGYFAAMCWAVAAAAGGFLAWNFPPARIFMGDVGASALGVMAASLSLWADRNGLFPVWLSMLVFSPFIVDATVTLLRRAMRGERLWVAHRNHYYQRLVQLGLGHRKTVLIEYLVMAGCSLTAIVLLGAPATVQWLGLGVWGLIYLTGSCVVAKLEAATH